MKIFAVMSRSTVALLAASSLAMSVPVYAAPISGAITLQVTKQEVLPVTAGECQDSCRLDQRAAPSASLGFSRTCRTGLQSRVALVQRWGCERRAS